MIERPIYADVLGQWPQLKTYNHGVALFKLKDGVSRETLQSEVEKATDKVTTAIPWLGERVVHKDVQPGNSGRFETAPWPEESKPSSIVRVRDCSDELPSYEEFLQAEMPVQWLKADLLCPVPGFPQTYDESRIGGAPACLVQITWIKGGLLINFSNHHNVMDGTGLFQFIALFALALNGRDFPAEMIEQGNRDRSTVVPLYPADQEIKDHSFLRAAPPAAPASLPAPSSPAKWLALRFHKEAIAGIKAMATDPAGYDKSVPFVSTGDGVSALYWKTLAKARISAGVDSSTTSKFSRTIDARSAVGVPFSYMGQMVYSSATWLTLKELSELPLSTIASMLRKNLNDANTEYAVRSYATFLAGEPDKSKLAYTGPFNRATDISSSSMAQAALVLKFGVLGVPNYIRRPNLAPIPGTLYFYPPDSSGDLNLLVCLNDEELKFLQADEIWGKCVQVIG